MKEDEWAELPAFESPRLAFGVTTFNDKYIFIFGGKVLRENASIKNQAWDFVDSVEVYDIDRASWRTINYISNKESLKLVHPGII